MRTIIPKIIFPEIFLGFVAPIGTDIEGSLKAFQHFFESNDYKVVTIKVTDVFPVISKYVVPKLPLRHGPVYERYNTYINYGDQLREYFSDDAVLAVSSIGLIVRQRARQKIARPFERTVYLIHQFKRKEEIDLLRSVYGRLFFQISVYSRRAARVDYLSRLFSHSEFVANSQSYRNKAEEIVQIDDNEVSDKHGQRVGEIFHDADFLINADVDRPIDEQITRFCELLFGSNILSPTRFEYGMFLAKAAALRSLDLSRQVGAAIFSRSGEIVTLGSNEVPKAGGGSYWCDETYDGRDYARKYDSNEQRKRENLSDLLKKLGKTESEIERMLRDSTVIDSQIMDALEYGRMVHAEMSALTDAARLGLSVKDAVLYCTTYPCHICAKHIVAAGISNVVFLEPYPKSLAVDLHADAIKSEGSERGAYQNYPSVNFEHFFGITPLRYRELFERGSRKENGQLVEYAGGAKRPIIDYTQPFYQDIENDIIQRSTEIIAKAIDESEETHTGA